MNITRRTLIGGAAGSGVLLAATAHAHTKSGPKEGDLVEVTSCRFCQEYYKGMSTQPPVPGYYKLGEPNSIGNSLVNESLASEYKVYDQNGNGSWVNRCSIPSKLQFQDLPVREVGSDVSFTYRDRLGAIIWYDHRGTQARLVHTKITAVLQIEDEKEHHLYGRVKYRTEFGDREAEKHVKDCLWLAENLESRGHWSYNREFFLHMSELSERQAASAQGIFERFVTPIV